MTLPSRHRSRNSSPGGLGPSTLPLGHGASSQYWILTNERGKKHLASLKFECQSGVRTRDLRLPRQAALTPATSIFKEQNTVLNIGLTTCGSRLLVLMFIWGGGAGSPTYNLYSPRLLYSIPPPPSLFVSDVRSSRHCWHSWQYIERCSVVHSQKGSNCSYCLGAQPKGSKMAVTAVTALVHSQKAVKRQ